MKAILLRTGSVAVHPPGLSGSPRVSLSRYDSIAGVFSLDKATVGSLRISLHSEIGIPSRRRTDSPIRRASSEYDVIESTKLSDVGSLSFSARILEEEEDVSYAGIWSASRIPEAQELGFSGCGGGVGGGDMRKIGDYYKEMLKANPNDSLLLRNYGKYLHEVVGDMERAEEYYGRAILESPGDGEVLSLYGKLIWDTQRDCKRAKSYFDQAVFTAPNDCVVLGSYAHFMWEAGEEEEDHGKAAEVSAAMVAAV